MEGLKPCPFCGETATSIVHDGVFSADWVVRCDCCGARGPWANKKQLATDDWNKRVEVA